MLVVLVRMLGRAGRDLLVRLVVHPSTGGANLRLAEWVSGGAARVPERSRRGYFVRVAEALASSSFMRCRGEDGCGRWPDCCANKNKQTDGRSGGDVWK